MFKRAIILFMVFVVFLSPVLSHAANADGLSQIRGVSHLSSLKRDQVVIYLNQPTEYSVDRISNPHRIVIDLKNTLSFGGHQKIAVSSNLLDAVRYAQFESGPKGHTARVVLDLKDAYRFEVMANLQNIIIYVYPEPDSNFPKSNTNSEYENEGEKEEEQHGQAGSGTSDRGSYDREDDSGISFGRILSELEDRIEISADGHSGYNVMRLTDPERVVVDFRGISLPTGEKTMNVNGKFVQKIRYAPLENTAGDTARVVLDLTGQHNYRYKEEGGKLVVTVDKPSYNHLKYHNNGFMPYLELEGLKLTNFQRWFDSTGRNMNISFPNGGKNIGNGEMLINDEYIKSIRIMSSSSTTTLLLFAREEYRYDVDPGSQADTAVVSIFRPLPALSDRLVVIDAGHGGSESGAMYGGVREKDLNLDIAIRLNKLLRGKGINTYMIREDDRYISHHNRGPIANELNASLFLSIHLNSYTDSTIRGTETYCFSTSSRGYKFAQIVHKHLLSTLGTVDRGIRTNDFAVLRTTAMPSVLAEIAYMSNESDLDLLKQESFRQKAAEALCNAIIEALEKM